VRVGLDRSEDGAIGVAIKDGCDLLFDTVAFDQIHARQLLEVQHHVGQIIAVSSASVYRDDQGRTLDEARENGFPELPEFMTEEQATVEPGPHTYSTRKVAMERALLEGTRVPAAILRPCAIHGPFSTHPREWWFVKRLIDGREAIPLAYHGLSRFQTSAAANIAELVSAITSGSAEGIYNIPDPDAPNVHEIGQAIVSACAKKAEFIQVAKGAKPPSIGVTPWSIPKPFTISDSRARGLGYEPVGDYRSTVAASCAWLANQPSERWKNLFPQLAAYPHDLFDYTSEDRYFAESTSGKHSK
ncbi:NAD-dependent epimerase/dehydratase family protein, partial [Altererythrobacter sp.]|uniref:NAD-dependent epimerase/dehydratase family protein n=1 Tax=Altererythrobacter sp. TaxID=1872480 RepID=UPI003D0C72E0